LNVMDLYGYLNKKVDNQKHFRNRWFVLKGKSIYFFKNDQDRDLLGSIDLRLVSDVTLPANDESQTLFILKSPNRTYYLEAKTAGERADWFKAIKNTQCFGVPLDILLKRKQGAYNKDVPTILSKCISLLNLRGTELERIYTQEGDPVFIQKLIALFNQDDVAVNLNILAISPQEIYSVAKLVQIFFQELPEPLVNPMFNQSFLRACATTDETERTKIYMDVVKTLPEVTLRILKKLCTSFELVISKQATNKMTLSKLSATFTPLLFPKTQGPEIPKEVESQQMFLEFLVSNGSTIYEGILADFSAKKPVRPSFSKALANMETSERAEIIETVTIIEVLIDDGSQSFTFPVTQGTTFKELFYNLVKRVITLQPDNLCAYHSIFENSPDYERALDNDEKVLQTMQNWYEPAATRLIFKRNSVKYLIETMSESFPEMTGWLYKEGVSVKSWKKRYFILRPSGLYYYRDPKNLNEEKGCINYQDLDVCITFNKRAPTKHCFALKHRSYKPPIRFNNGAATLLPSDFVCRILSAETSAERDSWMAAILHAKNLSEKGSPTNIAAPALETRKLERGQTVQSSASSSRSSLFRPRFQTENLINFS